MTLPMPEPIRKAKLGRPKGSLNKPAGARWWEPKTWKPIYEQMLLYQMMGRNNIDIATLTGRSAVNVGLVLGSKKAMARRQEIMRELQEMTLKSLDDKISEATIKAVDRVYDLMTDDEKYQGAPFAVADRAIKLLQGVGKLRKESETVKQSIGQAIILNVQESSEILDGLAEAEQVRRLHG